jgi:hypothetical protein
MTQQTISYGRRAATYWFVDGLPELLFGLMLIVFGGLAILWRVDGPEYWRRFDFAIFFAGIILYGSLERRVLDFLKLRFTYPRTGYVQPPEEEEWRGETMTTLPLRHRPPVRENVTSFHLRTELPIVFVAFLWSSDWQSGWSEIGRWYAPLATLALAMALYALNRKSEHPYRWWSALILALAGLVFLWVDVPGPFRHPLPLLLAGAWLSAQGAYTLIHYLRTNPLPRTAEGVRA